MRKVSMDSICCGLWTLFLFLSIVSHCNGGSPDWLDVYCPTLTLIIIYFAKAVR